MEPLKKPRGAYRKEFYAIFERMIGREMTPEEHENLKTLMVEYLRDCQMDLPPLPTKVEYTFTCRNCRQQTMGKGKDFRKKMVRKSAHAEVISTNSESPNPYSFDPQKDQKGVWRA